MVERRPGVARRVLTAAELELPMHSQAARFAAKEALAKALGVPSGLSFQDATVTRSPSGQPGFEVRGSVLHRVEELGVNAIHLSLSHDAGLAVAQVVCERT